MAALAIASISGMLAQACTIEKNTSLNGEEGVNIVSLVVRDRVVPLEKVTMRSMIIVGFLVSAPLDPRRSHSAGAVLSLNGTEISRDHIPFLEGRGGNFGFDIHEVSDPLQPGEVFSIPDGKYSIEISVLEGGRKVVAGGRKVLGREEIARTYMDPEGDFRKYRFVRDDARERAEVTAGRGGDDVCGPDKPFSVFRKGIVERIYPYTVPERSDCLDELKIEISRNEYRAVSIGVIASRDLGPITVGAGDLFSDTGRLAADALTVNAVSLLPEATSIDRNNKVVRVAQAPKILERGDDAVTASGTRAFWITLEVGADTAPGKYRGGLQLKAESGPSMEIPVEVEVLPFTLADTDIEYGMMMDYAFYELDNREWSPGERELITRSGERIYRDLREHGMTVAFPHSHFFYRTDMEGKPVLDSLRAALGEYRRNGFPGPFVWYLGHLLQTAKEKHPGSILCYEGDVAERRLGHLLTEYESMAEGLGIPKEQLVVQLVDEPDPDQKERVQAGRDLHRIAREMGFRTLITRPWPDADIVCGDGEKEERLHREGKEWWIYPNGALKSPNLAYSRYVFGYGAWRRGVDGVVPWTYQMTQGSNGNPFTVLDGPEVMVAYPGADGPLTTPTWEAIREGINDYKYVYLLRRMIEEGKQKGSAAAVRIEEQLEQLKERPFEGPGYEEHRYGNWTAEAFEETRRRVVGWARELQGI